MTKKLSKIERRAKELADSDIVAQIVGRTDIEYGEHTELPKGENVALLGRISPVCRTCLEPKEQLVNEGGLLFCTDCLSNYKKMMKWMSGEVA